MRRTLIRSILVACCLGAWLTGCSAGQLSESLPENMGGLPADTPPPPKVPYKFPAVHDMPPPRADKPLTDKQQWELEQNLTRLRKRQEAREAANGDGGQKPARHATKKTRKSRKKPMALHGSEGAGAKTKP
ncbi:MAG: hypothetical protein P8Y53_03825 [Pseudolabrys sp.]|jgi:hypothetical protein